jgi:hypothetical protein
LEDGRLKPDNNLVENAIRPFVVGRKNWLFSGRLFEKLPHAESDTDYISLLPYNIEKTNLLIDANIRGD